jgi:hypothetical protein
MCWSEKPEMSDRYWPTPQKIRLTGLVSVGSPKASRGISIISRRAKNETNSTKIKENENNKINRLVHFLRVKHNRL